MKQILLVSILCILAMGINAQAVLSVDPVSVSGVFQEDLSDEFLSLELKAKVTNVSGQTIQLKWVREEVQKPESWQTQICDNNTCYTPIVSSNIDPMLQLNAPAELAAGESFDLKFYVLPMGVTGEGEFKVHLSLVSAPGTVLQTATFNYTVESVTSTRELSKASLRVFPNPTTDYIELSGNSGLVDRLIVYNLIGRQIRTFNAVNGGRYQMYDLPAGMYLVSLVNNKEGVLKTLRVSKRTIRP